MDQRGRWAVFAVLLITIPALGQSDGILRWAGDKAGGAPFIYEEDGKLVGFESELAELIGQKLGLKPEFVQNQWDTLPDVLQRKSCDIVMNGLEYLPDREAEFPSTIPYFVYTLRLVAHQKDESIKNWEDLRSTKGKPKKRVGVLRGTFSERYMRQTFGEEIELISMNEVGEMLELVEARDRLDATIQDSPAAIHYVDGGEYPGLHVIGEARARGYYIILTRPDQGELRRSIDQILKDALRDGKLREILTKYGLWNGDQERLAYAHLVNWPIPSKDLEEDLKSTAEVSKKVHLISLWDRILKAAFLTIALACCAMPIAILLGIGIALGRVYGPSWLRFPLGVYVEIIRGTPLLLQMFVLFFLLPQLAQLTEISWIIWLSTPAPFVVGVIGLALNYSANESENYRAGLQAIPVGQMEAALCLGMTRAVALRRIIVPQAARLVIPPVTNDFIALFKDTSVCSMIMITELTGFYYQFKYDRDVVLELALTISLIYLLMSYPLSVLARRLEDHRNQGANR
jgi:polar amino acid transport system substrate-binding protein